MNFEFLYTLTSGSTDSSVGTCDTPEGRVKCVRKIYDEKDFDKIAENTLQFQDTIEKYGPTIYAIDNASRSISMEFIPGETLSDWLTEKINPWEKEGLDILRVLIKNVHKALLELHAASFCHDDTNPGNFMVLENFDVRLIDFDGLYADPANEDCTDMIDVKDHIMDALDDNIITRQQEANARFKAQRESISELLESCDSDLF